MTELFDQIEKLTPCLDGWCDVDKAHKLAMCVLALRPSTIVEIGVWGGRSLFPMALACKALNHGRVIGIDPWSPQASVQGQGEQDAKWWSEIPHELVYERFMKTLAELKLQFYVQVERKTSDDVCADGMVIDMLHIDGNHGPQAFIDAKRFAPRIRVGGLCCLDDLDWGEGAVRKAEAFILSIGFVKLYNLGTGALYQRMGAL